MQFLTSLLLALWLPGNGQAVERKSTPINFPRAKELVWAVQPFEPRRLTLGNSIDFFIKRKLKVETLTLANQAGPYEYIRRANL